MASQQLKTLFRVIVLLWAAHLPVMAQEAPDSNKHIKIDTDSYPVPAETPEMLFYLQRSLDFNSVIYAAHYEEPKVGHRKLDDEEPVDIYWLINDPAGSTKPLSTVQKLGYGVKPEDFEGDLVKIHLVAYRDMPIVLKPSPKDAKYHAHISVEGKDIILKKVFINIDGGTKLKPNITFIELTGTNAQNGNKVVHRFKP